jgi:hypothetical protein
MVTPPLKRETTQSLSLKATNPKDRITIRIFSLKLVGFKKVLK